MTKYLTDSFAGLDVVQADGDSYFFYDPERSLDPARRLPFATIVTGDRHDSVSNLDRAGVFRLNVDAGKESYRAMFGGNESPAGDAPAGHAFAALDRIMPHPVYGNMFWVCVLNPGEETFRSVQPLLAGAYERARKRATKTRARGES